MTFDCAFGIPVEEQCLYGTTSFYLSALLVVPEMIVGADGLAVDYIINGKARIAGLRIYIPETSVVANRFKIIWISICFADVNRYILS